jgi:hypothetical protein
VTDTQTVPSAHPVKNNRTFRKAAGDPEGTVYHQSSYFSGTDLAFFTIFRGRESLAGTLAFVKAAERDRALKLGPILHGLRSAMGNSLGWSYDQFGDATFSSLRSGSYRDAAAKEWSVQEVMDDSIDEILRVLGLSTPPVLPPPKPKTGALAAGVGHIKRRLAL